jgi:hypothetical protein
LVVRFPDIAGIVCHHCLNSLFINYKQIVTHTFISISVCHFSYSRDKRPPIYNNNENLYNKLISFQRFALCWDGNKLFCHEIMLLFLAVFRFFHLHALNLFFISYNLNILRDIHDLTRLIRNLNNVFIHYSVCVEVLMY